MMDKECENCSQLRDCDDCPAMIRSVFRETVTVGELLDAINECERPVKNRLNSKEKLNSLQCIQLHTQLDAFDILSTELRKLFLKGGS